MISFICWVTGAITVIAEKTVEYAVAQCQYKENNRQDDECLGEEFHFNTSCGVIDRSVY